MAWLVDRAAVSDVNTRYAFAVDRRDWTALEDCFTEDLDPSGWGPRGLSGRAEMLEFIKGVAHFHTTMHMMGNQFVALDGDRATLDCYAMITHHYERSGEPRQMNLTNSRYIEGLRRDGDRWRIDRRAGQPTWTASSPSPRSQSSATVRALQDRVEINDLLMRYALAIDLRDYGLLAGCFASSFTARYGKSTFTEIGPLVDFVRGVEHFPSTTHFFARPLIEVRGEEALAITAAMISHRPDPGEEWMSAGPMYRDRLVREAGEWRVAERGIELGQLLPEAALTVDTDAPALRWLVDRESVRHTVTAINRAVDDGARDDLAEWLADGAVGVDPSAMCGSTCHWTGIQMIDFDDEFVEAQAETYVFRSERREGARTYAGWADHPLRFDDRLVKKEGRWLLAERRVSDNRVSPDLVRSGA